MKDSMTLKYGMPIISFLSMAVILFLPMIYILPGIIVLLGIVWLNTTTKDNFLQFQDALPTTKVRSLMMGLVEVNGYVKPMKVIHSKLGSHKCIAYSYSLYRQYIDSEGVCKSELVEQKTEINDFCVHDDTGAVKVLAKDLDLTLLTELGSYQDGDLYYRQKVLLENEQVLLVGKACRVNGQILIEKDEINDLFSLVPVESLNKWKLFKPLLQKFLIYLVISAVFVAAILLTNVELSAQAIHFRF